MGLEAGNETEGKNLLGGRRRYCPMCRASSVASRPPSLPSWARVTVNGVSNGSGVSLLVCGASEYKENAKGALKSCDRYFIMNSKDQSQGSSLLQGLFLEIL